MLIREFSSDRSVYLRGLPVFGRISCERRARPRTFCLLSPVDSPCAPARSGLGAHRARGGRQRARTERFSTLFDAFERKTARFGLAPQRPIGGMGKMSAPARIKRAGVRRRVASLSDDQIARKKSGERREETGGEAARESRREASTHRSAMSDTFLTHAARCSLSSRTRRRTGRRCRSRSRRVPCRRTSCRSCLRSCRPGRRVRGAARR